MDIKNLGGLDDVDVVLKHLLALLELLYYSSIIPERCLYEETRRIDMVIERLQQAPGGPINKRDPRMSSKQCLDSSDAHDLHAEDPRLRT